MLGYWQNPDATRQIVSGDGWLNSGDTARIDDRGHVYITGRLKEIIVTSTGEKIAPIDVESAIVADPLFEQVILLGEAKPFLSVIAVLNRDDPHFDYWVRVAGTRPVQSFGTTAEAAVHGVYQLSAASCEIEIATAAGRVPATLQVPGLHNVANALAAAGGARGLGATIEQVGWELFRLMLDVASGRKKTWAEQWKLHNQLVLFNPAPVT